MPHLNLIMPHVANGDEIQQCWTSSFVYAWNALNIKPRICKIPETKSANNGDHLYCKIILLLTLSWSIITKSGQKIKMVHKTLEVKSKPNYANWSARILFSIRMQIWKKKKKRFARNPRISKTEKKYFCCKNLKIIFEFKSISSICSYYDGVRVFCNEK